MAKEQFRTKIPKGKIKVLNLYAGIGGNRKLWDKYNIDVTAVEIDVKIAERYKKLFPQDKIVIDDAHDYLLKHFKEFDFIWSSPPCQSHSRTNYFLKGKGIFRYPDLKLYEEIIFLRRYATCKWVVENVISDYKPLIIPKEVGRHYLWSNFNINRTNCPKDDIGKMCGKNQKAHNKPLEERNAVDSKLGLYIFECAYKFKQKTVADFHSTETHNSMHTLCLKRAS